MRLLLNGGHHTDAEPLGLDRAEPLGLDRAGRRVWDDGGPNLLIEGLDCEPEPEDDGDPFPGECRFERACRDLDNRR